LLFDLTHGLRSDCLVGGGGSFPPPHVAKIPGPGPLWGEWWTAAQLAQAVHCLLKLRCIRNHKPASHHPPEASASVR
jgi:hypothetical protein